MSAVCLRFNRDINHHDFNILFRTTLEQGDARLLESVPDQPVLISSHHSKQLLFNLSLLSEHLPQHCHQLQFSPSLLPLVSSSLMSSVHSWRVFNSTPRKITATRYSCDAMNVAHQRIIVQFYKCANGTLTLETCGNGLLFDESRALAGSAHNHCAYNWEAECGARPADNTPISTPGCEYQFGIFPSGEGCFASYTKCANGIPKEVENDIINEGYLPIPPPMSRSIVSLVWLMITVSTPVTGLIY